MDNIELKTPGGYIVTIKPELTYGQYLELQEMWASGVKADTENIDPVTKQPKVIMELDGKAILAGRRKAREFLVIKIVDPQGNEVTNIVGALSDMPQSDGLAIAAKVEEITAKAQLSKKGGA